MLKTNFKCHKKQREELVSKIMKKFFEFNFVFHGKLKSDFRIIYILLFVKLVYNIFNMFIYTLFTYTLFRKRRSLSDSDEEKYRKKSRHQDRNVRKDSEDSHRRR